MPQHEVRGDRAVYDHETDESRGGRRRRQVADWGVGEELFEHMPSPRRRFRTPAEAPSGRRNAHQRDRRLEPARDDAPPSRTPLVPIDEAPTREHVLPRSEPAVEPVGEPRGTEVARRDEPRGASVARRDEPGVDASRRGVTPRGGVEGRRTVVIGGQASVARRPRPQRTVGERLGPRPDRIASWAVALGVLLIVITILSQ